MSENSDRAPVVVVGFDGSDQSCYALEWAVAQVSQRPGAHLRIVTAYSMPVFAATGLDGGFATIDEESIREGAQAVAGEAVKRVGGRVPVSTEVERGDPAGLLVHLSAAAELLVVGTRGRGGFMGRLLGSVSSALPGHARCPVVIVPKSYADRLANASGPITVGVDGSEQARYAMLVAAEFAQRAKSPLRVVCAVPEITAALAWVPTHVDRSELLAEVKGRVEAGRRWLTHHFPGLGVEVQVCDGAPVEVLVDESESSQLVVVGKRGYGGFTGMVLGSTTDGLLHHTKCPVLVVRDIPDARLEDRPQFGPVLEGCNGFGYE